MRIWFLSDLHTEFESHNVGYWGVPEDVDIAVATGDIARGGRAHVEWLQQHIASHTRFGVVSCLGNHEFYRSSIERERIEAGRAAVQSNVHVLDDMTWTVGGVRFVGATLWTDYNIFNPSADPLINEQYRYVARQGLNDHKKIRLVSNDSRQFLPAHALQIHRRSVAFIESVLSTPFAGETVVLTHHGPARGSIGEEFKNDSLTAAYISNLEPLIERYQPAAWFHGHVHQNFDYQVGRTRVLTNPKGYGLENKRGFDPRMIIDLDDLMPRPKSP